MRLAAIGLCLVAFALPCQAAPKHVIIITMENKDAEKGAQGKNYIYGNRDAAPYINDELLPQAARAANFVDELLQYKSQPHYIVMEAGANAFEDTTFTCDSDPLERCKDSGGAPNWTMSPSHLAAQITAARNPALTWMTYQEGIDPAKTGACPIHSAGLYAAKHNPFVYFSDVSGAPPSADNAYCIAHTRALSRFAADMQSGDVASYVFISPNLCNDMHGALQCPDRPVAKGDDFLKSFLPPLLAWAGTHDAVVLVTWDEGKAGHALPFIAAGAGVKAGYESQVKLSHRSIVRTVERIFGLPVLPAVKDVNDLGDLFEPGVLP